MNEIENLEKIKFQKFLLKSNKDVIFYKFFHNINQGY
jgi:hypothetical protein